MNDRREIVTRALPIPVRKQERMSIWQELPGRRMGLDRRNGIYERVGASGAALTGMGVGMGEFLSQMKRSL
ncbi:MAG: hypothetical protein IPK15_19370 [Verrucomicrobia bacterium]|nr:hypothetical protein [Verrucomicrobiota bacterium]